MKENQFELPSEQAKEGAIKHNAVEIGQEELDKILGKKSVEVKEEPEVPKMAKESPTEKGATGAFLEGREKLDNTYQGEQPQHNAEKISQDKLNEILEKIKQERQ